MSRSIVSVSRSCSGALVLNSPVVSISLITSGAWGQDRQITLFTLLFTPRSAAIPTLLPHLALGVDDDQRDCVRAPMYWRGFRWYPPGSRDLLAAGASPEMPTFRGRQGSIGATRPSSPRRPRPPTRARARGLTGGGRPGRGVPGRSSQDVARASSRSLAGIARRSPMRGIPPRPSTRYRGVHSTPSMRRACRMPPSTRPRIATATTTSAGTLRRGTRTPGRCTTGCMVCGPRSR